MLKKLDECDIVLLSRYVRGGGDQRSKMRILSSKIINLICRVILGNDIKDYTSSIFLMKRNVLTHGVPIAYGHGEFFIEFLYKIKNGVKIYELPYVQPPDVDGSKTASSITRFFSLGLSYLIRIFIIKFRKIKMIEQIYNQKKLYALIVRNSYRKKKGISFFTDNKASQQVGFMKHKKNHIILPHKHNKRKKMLLQK